MAKNPASYYGTDVKCIEDSDSMFSSVTGIAVVRQAAIHRLTCDDVLGPGGDGWGFDCRRLLGSKSEELQGYQPILVEVLTRDPRMLSAEVVLTSTRKGNGTEDIEMRVHGETQFGPFDLVKSISELTAADIEGQA